MTGWYVAKSKPQKEAWLTASLNSLGVEVFFPRITTRRQRNRTLEPLFPTYLFCRFDPTDGDWPSIRWAPGLNYFLGVDGQPTRVPDSLVEYIKDRVEQWNNNGHRDWRLNPGDSVRIAQGSFAGLEGIFQQYLPSKQRCRILLQIVGRLATVELAESDLAAPTPRL